MTTVVGVNFKRAGKVYWFDPGNLDYEEGQGVIVETARGVEYGEVSGGKKDVPDEMVVQPLKQVVRHATEEDLRRIEENKEKEQEAFAIAQEKIIKHGLEMKLVEVEFAFDGSRVLFYFTANGRVDFRELVRDLASQFRTRIELRQIGVRDEAKMLGGLGPCGRPICCRQFLPDFQPVSIRMAKEQNLSLNPTKISGQCGRLMCCLKYEQDTYECARKRVPKLGREVVTPDGMGIVIDINVLKERIRVKLQLEDGSYDIREYRFDESARKGEPAPARFVEEPEELDNIEVFMGETRDFAGEPEPAAQEQRPPRNNRKPRRGTGRAPQEESQGEKPESQQPIAQEAPEARPEGEQRRRNNRRRPHQRPRPKE